MQKIKKLVFSVMVGAMAMCMGEVYADNLTPQQAREGAASYMRWIGQRNGLSANELTLVHEVMNPNLGVPAAYYYNLPGEGWIIMAGTTVIDPVIAYSHEGRLDMDRLPANMRWWMDGYIGMVMEIQDDDVQKDLPESQQWVDLSNGKPGGGAKDTEHYLLKANWGQGDELDPTYNLYCPHIQGVKDSTCIVGCVATALSMICHHYRYPVQPTGTRNYTWRSMGKLLNITYDTISFDYSLMPNRLMPNSTEAQVREVAKLSRAVGYAVKMNYGAGAGSGAQSADVPPAMKQYFKYNLGTQRFRAADSDQSYVSAMRSELKKNNVLYMSGASSTNGGRDAAGHAWVCGGYREIDSNWYYMNWGWDGGGNGFFNLAINHMAISGYGYNFKVRQAVIIGMTPPDDSNRFIVGIRDVAMGSTVGYAYPNPATLSVTLPYSSREAGDLSIYAVDGRLVETRRVAAGEGEVEVRVDGLPAGIYVYRLGGATGKFIVK